MTRKHQDEPRREREQPDDPLGLGEGGAVERPAQASDLSDVGT